MKLSISSIKRPVTTSMFFIAIAILGIYAFSRLGVDLLPNVNIPHLLIQTNYKNATPEEVEKLITEPLESVIGTVTGVDKLTSVSKEGTSIISVKFVWGTDMDFAILSLREKLDNISYSLPREAERSTIIKSDPSASPIVTLALTYNDDNSYKIAVKDTLQSLGSSEIHNNKISYIDYDSPYEEIKQLVDLKEAGRVLFKRRFEQLDGVAQAVVTGGLVREILIEVDPVKLEEYNLTFDQIQNALANSNINLPAGSIMKGLFRYSLRTKGEFNNAEEIKATIIKYNNNGSSIKLSDIASVKESFKERQGLTRLNGNETVGLLIYKESDENTVTVSQKVKNVIKILEDEYPEYNLVLVSDQSGFIEAAISNVKQEIVYGGILAVIVLFFFLGSLRNVLIIGVTIPSSLCLTILMMYLFDINFNVISLGGIAVGVGMLLDNSIIVIENIVRYGEEGKSIREAASIGSSEVAMPVVAATLTTIVVFLPLIFVSGIAGELFRDQSYAIAFSLTSSIFTSLTLIPMLASRDKITLVSDAEKYNKDFIYLNYPTNKNIFYKLLFWLRFPVVFPIRSILFITIKFALVFSKFAQNRFDKFYSVVNQKLDLVIEKYEVMLEWALDNKVKVIILTLGLIVLTVLAAIDIDKEFIPDSPRDEFIVELDYPNGTSLRGNAELTAKIEDVILKYPKVKNVISNIGLVNEYDYLNREQMAVDKTNLIIKIDSDDSYYLVQNKLKQLFDNVTGLDYSFQPVKTTYTELVNPSKDDIAIKIADKNINNAYLKAEEIIEEIKKENVKGVDGLYIGIEKGTPEYTVTVNREKCNEYSIPVEIVVNELVNLVKGKSEISFSDFDSKVAINIRSTENNRNALNNVINNYLTVDSIKIPIKNLIEYTFHETFNQVWRENQTRTIPIYASVYDRNLSDAILEIENVIGNFPKVSDQNITIGGLNEEISDSFSGLYVALCISVLLMYMILASEFESFLYPFIIIFSVPLGLIGGIICLYIFGSSISIISIMGLIILVGIADNDAVVKVEFIMRKREEGLSVRDSIMQAGKDRFRPIVMNSFTVIFAMIPMMFSVGAGTQLRLSLSVAVAGGLVSSTFLTLIIIPVLYTYLEKYSKKK